MSYLADLIKTLNEEELRQFRLLDVISKQELVRDAYSKFVREKHFDENTLPEKLGISELHLRKINSVLLDKTIDKLWGDDYRKVFAEITNKGLVPLVLHLIKKNETRFRKTNSNEQITVYYKQVFDILSGLHYPHNKPELRNEYAQKYLASLGSKKRLEDEAQVAMEMLFADIGNQFFNLNNSDFKPKVVSTLAEWKKKSEKNSSASFYVARVALEYQKYFGDDAKFYLEAAEQALQAFYNAKGMVEDRYEAPLRADEALGYLITDNYNEALARYGKLMTPRKRYSRSVQHCRNESVFRKYQLTCEYRNKPFCSSQRHVHRENKQCTKCVGETDNCGINQE